MRDLPLRSCEMNIQDNVFIVTGAASGLGAATADAIATAGGTVVAVDVKPGNDMQGR